MTPFNLKRSAKKLLRPLFSRSFLCGLLTSLFLAAQAQWETINTLEKDWLIFQPSWNAFLPYIPSNHYTFKSKSVQINPEAYPNGYLKINVNQELDLFVNGILQQKIIPNQVFFLNLDSLKKLNLKIPLLTFTFYHGSLVGIPKNISIERLRRSRKVASADFLNFKNRNTSTFQNFFTFSMLSLLCLIAVLFSVFPKYFNAYFRFSDWLYWGEFKDEVIAKTPFAFPNFIVILILSLSVAYLSFLNGLTHQTRDTFFNNPENYQVFVDVLLFLITKAGIAFALFAGRYFIYRIFSSLFRLTDLAEMYFFKSLQTNIQFFILLFLIFGLYAVYYGPLFFQNVGLISNLIYAFLCLRALYFFQIFRKKFRNNQISFLAYLIIIEGQVFLFGIRELIILEYM